MSTFYILLAGSLLAALLFRTFCPYLWRDLRVTLRMFGFGLKFSSYGRRKPPVTLVDVFLQKVQKWPDKPFVVFEGRVLTYSELDRLSNKLGRAVQARAGLRQGDCVAILLGNQPLFVALWLGLAKLGCPVAFLNYNIRGKSLLHCFQRSGAQVLIAGSGLPKAAIITHSRGHRIAFFIAACGLSSSDIIYITLPLYHSAGSLIGICGCIALGATVVLRRKFSASQFWDDCRTYNVTVIQYIGEVLRYLCNVPKKSSDRDHQVKIAVGNGARADVWKEFLNRFGDIQVCEFYGATEGNVGFMNYVGKIGALGRVTFLTRKTMPFYLIKYDVEQEVPVRDAKGHCIEVAKGEAGLLIGKITRTTPFAGYAGNAILTEKKHLRDVFCKGDLYFNSGDLLKLDHDNFIYFQDRIGDTFRWKGENVSTSEVADVLLMLEFVKEACVYGVAVPGHEGRIGMAAIQLPSGEDLDGAQLYEHVAAHLPNYARPRFLREQTRIETTGTFKHYKVMLVKEGFNPATVQDSLFILDDQKRTYARMDQGIYNSIISKQVKL
uniref:long-chain fatty acid transport protein 2-like isoform X3 n=1 Tax=Pristiophorus japonicus TaxID=55135 RepID=UPI00398F5331